MKKILKYHFEAFTLIEMLIVMVIISILLLLFVPNLSKQKEEVQAKGETAVVRVVEAQADIYEITNEKLPSIAQLVSENYITEKQANTYQAYYQKHPEDKSKLKID
ncbi:MULTISPECIES: competence type IV pilus major pilin ComGC [unclassified Enterococcus]|uniref:competence type IV pilus major pilin ComGC n=1 Tax=unclassified Enterococcus TaxID=2608891 RepID=UPI0015518A15|nr:MULTISPECIES: competence type IV pilus major pilin ComGC [unclassified Enterococcus]